MQTTKLALFTAEQIAEVQRSLSKIEIAQLANIRLPGFQRDGVSLEDLLLALFSRSASDSALRFSPEKATHIVKGTLSALSALDSHSNKVVISSVVGEIDSLFIALEDRPFIVSTIAERLSDDDVKVQMFLHPVMAYNGKVRAFSYIELHEDASLPTGIEARIQESLLSLIQIVDDFDGMVAVVRKFLSCLPSETLTSEFGPIESTELVQLLEWFCDGGFFLIGVRTQCSTSGSRNELLQNSSPLGIWRLQGESGSQTRDEAIADILAVHTCPTALSFRKLRSTSSVHRRTTLMHVVVNDTSSGQSLSLIGYLTSKAWTSEVQDIPVLRQKVNQVLRNEAVIPNSHDYKYIAEIVDNMPTDEAFCCTIEQLRSIIQLSLGVFSREVTRALTYIDPLQRRALTMVVLPPERYSAAIRAQMQEQIESFLGSAPGSSELHLDSSKRGQFRMYVSSPLPIDFSGLKPLATLANSLAEMTLTWDERLFAEIENTQFDADEFFSERSFPPEYKAAITVADAVVDCNLIRKVLSDKSVEVSLNSDSTHGGDPSITILSENPDLSISRAIPVLENVGLEARRARSYLITTNAGIVYVLKLIVRAHDGFVLDSTAFSQRVGPGLAAIISGAAHNDALNSLLRSTPLTVREISLLRTYCAFLWQINKFTTRRAMWESLALAPRAALQLWYIFVSKFQPDLHISQPDRHTRMLAEESLLIDELRSIPDITQDRVLKALLSLIKATVRTNFFSETDTIAVKISSNEVEVIPHPKPLFEIFVFSPRIEGTHLRSARVARGGIRWSERLDDYRSEVLGLMKTQKVKNVIIVPSGAKGGFVVKNPPKEAQLMPMVVEAAYREYIRALLSLADNQTDAGIVHPPTLIVHDLPDPYFVVAADKGTATFSDIANGIAQNEFNFWLEDAFASGGSAGYDHKKYGITARGGWQCVVRHFKDLEIDYENSPFTVVGLGDMSGDVFGNGLLLSRQMKLIAAFNHKHIFIDPNPDPESSYAERERLFKLSRSQWSDYSPSLISEGGGVFSRFDKEIFLSTQIRGALQIPHEIPNAIDGEQLISCILKAQVDLMWNGGIGTYVKSVTESHSEVNDGTNDRVRINATELRAKIVGEGGNLGFTQRARVEYSELGGRINTDAIDNSGGVDLSDHEVNLKLLLNPLVKSGSISKDARDSLLKDIANDVTDSVLSHNRDQALMLTVSREHSRKNIEKYRAVIRDMHRKGYLDRMRDDLPDEMELDERATSKAGLYRPELAVCSAAIKMWIKDGLRDSDLCDDRAVEPLLLHYFPQRIQSEFHTPLTSHSLRREIISNEIVNSLLPAVGISFVHNMAAIHGAPIATVMKALLAADRILNTLSLRGSLLSLDQAHTRESFFTLWNDAGTALREASEWLLNYHASSLSLSQMIELYSEPFDTLLEHVDEVFTDQEYVRFTRRVSQYESLGIQHQHAVSFAVYRRVLPVLEVLWASRQFQRDERQVATTFSQVLDELSITAVLKFEAVLEASNHWEQELIVGSYQEIRRSISLITGQVLGKNLKSSAEIRDVLRASLGYESIRATMQELEDLGRQKRPFQVAVLPVVARQLRLFRV